MPSVQVLPFQDYIPLTQKDQPDGVAGLDNTGKVPKTKLPDSASSKLKAVGNVNNLRAVTEYSDGVAITVKNMKIDFVFDSTSMREDDGVTVVKPDDLLITDPGRWITLSFGEVYKIIKYDMATITGSTLDDDSNYNRDATVFNVTQNTDNLYFNGIDSYTITPVPEKFLFKNFTISIWFKTLSVVQPQTLFYYKDSAGNGVEIYIRKRGYLGTTISGPNGGNVKSKRNDIVANTVYNVIVTYTQSGGMLYQYINGTFIIDSTSGKTMPNMLATNFYIGNNDTPDNPFYGNVYDVFLMTKYLDQGGVQDLFASKEGMFT